MDGREAAEVLAGRERAGRPPASLRSRTAGRQLSAWRASHRPRSTGSIEVPESLYRFFAKEVFEAFEPDVQSGSSRPRVAPVLDRLSSPRSFSARSSAERVCSSALDVGVMVERSGQLELHPTRTLVPGRATDAISARHAIPIGWRRALRHYRDRRDWDAAFELVARHGLTLELEELLLVDALDELLDTAVSQPSRHGASFASDAGLVTPCSLSPELRLRFGRGRFTEAQIQREVARPLEPDLTFRALRSQDGPHTLLRRRRRHSSFYERAAERAASTEARTDVTLSGDSSCLPDRS